MRNECDRSMQKSRQAKSNQKVNSPYFIIVIVIVTLPESNEESCREEKLLVHTITLQQQNDLPQR
jgi:hypothetical protein